MGLKEHMDVQIMTRRNAIHTPRVVFDESREYGEDLLSAMRDRSRG